MTDASKIYSKMSPKIVTTYLNEQNSSANGITYKSNINQVQNGDFSHNYVFENGCTCEIFLRIDNEICSLDYKY